MLSTVHNTSHLNVRYTNTYIGVYCPDLFKVCDCLVLFFEHTNYHYYYYYTVCDIISRNVGTNSYCSFTDTQFFYGSQFWPENSQGASQDVSLSSRTSQQSSEVRFSCVIDKLH